MDLRVAAFALTLATLAACGDSAGPGPGLVSHDDAEEGCRRDCEHTITCNPQSTQTVDACTADCVTDVIGYLRGDAFAALVDCRTSLACGADGQACATTCAPTATHASFEAQCRAIFSTCADPAELDGICETTPVAGGDVGGLCLVTPSIVDEMTACIPDGTACQAGLDCLRAVFDAHHIDL